ncbi:MAG: hypothetical protein HPY52_14875 [Firmicutes bacterium]|nr:hypothetical protein [Bacillota bacterium]
MSIAEIEELLFRIYKLPAEHQLMIINKIKERLEVNEIQKANAVVVKQALRETAGAWTDENHPDLTSIEDIHRWLEEIRRPTNERMEGRYKDLS